jgi:hypothetical protein
VAPPDCRCPLHMGLAARSCDTVARSVGAVDTRGLAPVFAPPLPCQARNTYNALVEQLESTQAAGSGAGKGKADFAAALTALFKDAALCLEVRTGQRPPGPTRGREGRFRCRLDVAVWTCDCHGGGKGAATEL